MLKIYQENHLFLLADYEVFNAHKMQFVLPFSLLSPSIPVLISV